MRYEFNIYFAKASNDTRFSYSRKTDHCHDHAIFRCTTKLDACFTQAQRWHASVGQKPREELRPQLQRNRQQQASQKRTL